MPSGSLLLLAAALAWPCGHASAAGGTHRRGADVLQASPSCTGDGFARGFNTLFEVPSGDFLATDVKRHGAGALHLKSTKPRPDTIVDSAGGTTPDVISFSIRAAGPKWTGDTAQFDFDAFSIALLDDGVVAVNGDPIGNCEEGLCLRLDTWARVAVLADWAAGTFRVVVTYRDDGAIGFAGVPQYTPGWPQQHQTGTFAIEAARVDTVTTSVGGGGGQAFYVDDMFFNCTADDPTGVPTTLMPPPPDNTTATATGDGEYDPTTSGGGGTLGMVLATLVGVALVCVMCGLFHYRWSQHKLAPSEVSDTDERDMDEASRSLLDDLPASSEAGAPGASVSGRYDPRALSTTIGSVEPVSPAFQLQPPRKLPAVPASPGGVSVASRASLMMEGFAGSPRATGLGPGSSPNGPGPPKRRGSPMLGGPARPVGNGAVASFGVDTSSPRTALAATAGDGTARDPPAKKKKKKKDAPAPPEE